MSKKTEAQEAIDLLKPQLTKVNKLITAMRNAQVELEQYDALGEFDGAIELIEGIKQDIDIEIKGYQSIIDAQ